MNPTAHTGPTRRLMIEFLYLDRSRCTRCRQTDATLDDALAELERDLREAGVAVEVRKIHVRDEAQARALGFASSPTIRINGSDIAPEITETACAGCSCGCEETGIMCRAWTYQGRQYDAPPKELIVDAIRRAVAGPRDERVKTDVSTREIPDNLKRFFVAQRRTEPAIPGGTQCC